MAFVSVDGGATKTMAVCYDSSGKILGMAANGPSNFRNIGVENAKIHLTSAVKGAIERSGLEFSDIDRITFALAGVKDSQKSTEIIDSFVKELKFNAPYSLLNDGEAGYNCRFFGEEGIIAAAGTGMIAFGKFNGNFERSSGWGWLIGDEGGAFYIGRRAIQEAAKLSDGRNVGSVELLSKVMGFFGVKEPRHLVNEVYTNPINIRRIALLAREVSLLSNMGDDISRSIITEAAIEAGRCVNALKRKYNSPQATVSGYGGVFRAGELYWNSLRDSVLSEFPDSQFKNPLYGYHAVLGSMYIVLKEGNHLDPDTEAILRDFDANVELLPIEEKQQFLLL